MLVYVTTFFEVAGNMADGVTVFDNVFPCLDVRKQYFMRFRNILQCCNSVFGIAFLQVVKRNSNIIFAVNLNQL